MRWEGAIADQKTHHQELVVPTRILVTGDTHLGARRDWLPEALTERMTQVDLIIHTGDFPSVAAMELFRARTDVLGVSGNNDCDELQHRLPERLVLTAGKTKIIVTHGHRERGRSARDGVTRAYQGSADMVVFGHSHRACWEEVNGTWFLNPGSSTMKRWEPQFSFAIVDLDRSGHFTVEFVYFDKQIRPSGDSSGGY